MTGLLLFSERDAYLWWRRDIWTLNACPRGRIGMIRLLLNRPDIIDGRRPDVWPLNAGQRPG